MIKKTKVPKNLLRLLHKFNRYDKREKWFVLYLFILLFFLLFLPIIKVSSLRGSGGYSVWLVSGVYFKSMVIILISMLLLIGRNISFKFKNILISYFGLKQNDSLINFLFLFIITTSFFAITDTINLSQAEISRIGVSFWGNLIQVLLLLGLIMTLVSVMKSAKELGKKTKIINMVDDDHKKDSHKEDIKKGLFE